MCSALSVGQTGEAWDPETARRLGVQSRKSRRQLRDVYMHAGQLEKWQDLKQEGRDIPSSTHPLLHALFPAYMYPCISIYFAKIVVFTYW